jgi:hypothetical protein
MRQAIFKTKMSREELHEYWKNWADAFRPENTGDSVYLLNSNICISVSSKDNYGDKVTMNVYGHNHIKLGIFEPDNGCVWGEQGIYAYYPTLTFYNNLNKVGINYNVGEPNNTRVEMTTQGMIINEENLLKAIRDSFSYIKIFEDKDG